MIEKGVYYRPRKSVLGLGKLPIYQDEQFRYLTQKLNGYITGAYVYNKMGLTIEYYVFTCKNISIILLKYCV